MQPAYEKVTLGAGRTHRLWVRSEPRFEFNWHLHPEFELTLITRGRGMRVVGDHVADYEAGDLVLLGPDVPHTWASRAGAPRGGRRANEALVLHFTPDLFGAHALREPEHARLARLLERAPRGVWVRAGSATRAAVLMREAYACEGLRRTARLLEVFDLLSRCRGVVLLSSGPPGRGASGVIRRRADAIFQHINERCLEPLSIASVARQFGLSISTVHRLLRRATGRSFTRLVNDLRIGHACDLLARTEQRVIEICYRSGFQNLSHFNRIFLNLKKCTPRAYRAAMTGSGARES